MKYLASLLPLLLATVASSAPAEDPLNVDVCGLGTDIDLTPQASVDGEFKVGVQKYDFTGPTFNLGNDRDGSKAVRMTEAAKALSLTLEGGTLKSALGLIGLCPTFSAVTLCVSPPQKPLPFQVRSVCDPVSKSAVQVLELVPGAQASKAIESRRYLPG